MPRPWTRASRPRASRPGHAGPAASVTGSSFSYQPALSAAAESSTCRKTFGRESKNLRPGVKLSRHFLSRFDGDVPDGDFDSRGKAGTADAPPVLDQICFNARCRGPREY